MSDQITLVLTWDVDGLVILSAHSDEAKAREVALREFLTGRANDRIPVQWREHYGTTELWSFEWRKRYGTMASDGDWHDTGYAIRTIPVT